MLISATRAAMVIATAVLSLAGSGAAMAGTTVVHFCDGPDGPAAAPLPTGPLWSLQSVGTSEVGGKTPTASLTCRTVAGKGLSMLGPGGYGDLIYPGASAMVTFTPPAGSKIVAVSAQRQIYMSQNSRTEAGIYTSDGRLLGSDTQPWTTATSVIKEPVVLDEAALGVDGARGLSWGIRCPATSPAPYASCGGGVFALHGMITVSDGLPDPTPTPAPVPTPDPTQTPSPISPITATTPAPTPLAEVRNSVTLKTQRKKRSLVISGSAVGCAYVKVSIPGKRSLDVLVRKGTWKSTVKFRVGSYTARCAKASATRRAR